MNMPSIQTDELRHAHQEYTFECLDLKKRCKLSYPIGMTGALILQEVQKPWVHRSRRTQRPPRRFTFVVPDHNARSHVKDVEFAPWDMPLMTDVDPARIEHTVGACTWLMLSLRLDDEQVVTLAESMMRRDMALKRSNIEDFFSYLDTVDEFSARKEHGRRRAMRGSVRARELLALVRENTDSPMETKLGLRISQYGLGRPVVNHVLWLRNGRKVILDLAFPLVKIAIEYDGEFHRDQWLEDQQRRTLIEDEGWIYIQVTKLDFATPEAEQKLMERIANRLEERMERRVELAAPMPLRALAKHPELYLDRPWLAA